MPRTLTPTSSLDDLRREAKRWLKALRANDGEARARYARAVPDALGAPTLRAVQHALARELGFAGWTDLKQRKLTELGASKPDAALVARFLDNACPDHHVRGGPDHVRARHTALRLLARDPEIAHSSFQTEIVCGNLAAVEQALTANPSLAARRDAAPRAERADAGERGDLLIHDLGPKGWEPLLYLCFARLPLPAASDNAVAIARALLDRGADPNAYFMAGGSRYTALVGVIGEGEENRPPHPQRDALVRLLLERGAEPYDRQVLYDIHFHGDVLWFLELIYERSLEIGRRTDWDDPDWSMLDMGGYGSGARWHLDLAIEHGDVRLAEWCLAHGAGPNAAPARDARMPQESLYARAVAQGQMEIAALLVRYGATRSEVALSGVHALAAAALRLDERTARALVAAGPELLRASLPLAQAARRDRADAAELLLALGVSPDVESERKERALHVAAYKNALNVARLLIERGAEIDPVESSYGNTPLGCAVYAQHAEMIDLLSRYSRDVWELTAAGKIERLREIFAEHPERARVTWQGNTPLMWVAPDDEARAIAIARLFLAYGADPDVRTPDGETAADRAERLAMLELAALLRDASAAPTRYPTIRRYEEMADNLLAAYRTGTPEAMERHWNDTWHRRSWAAMRRYVQLDLGRRAESEEGSAPSSADPAFDISIADARFLIAREHRQPSWRALADHIAAATPGEQPSPGCGVMLWTGDGTSTARPTIVDGWAAGIEHARALGATGLATDGTMTDTMLRAVAELDHVTTLRLSGSRSISAEGFRLLARMPQLRDLDLSRTSVTDADLAVLADLPALERVDLSHTAVTDGGARYLGHCRRLERVLLAWTAMGDGAIRALAGQPRLRHLHTGRLVTDAGIDLLRAIPSFENWQGGDVCAAPLEMDALPNLLTLRGSFTDGGLARLARLHGLFGLDVADGDLGITPRGLAPLAGLPHLGWLAIEATDESMPYVAAMPALRGFMCQDTQSTDDGWIALSRSRSIERIWGRRCHGLRDRGFIALSTMPALRNLAVSCRNVGDDGLAALPAFPSLRELMPIDVGDEGYRFVGQCVALDALTLMYCRDTTDRATEHILALPKLRRYFASYTRITDRTPELLSGIGSLEEVVLASCAAVTNTGAAALARLPRLRTVRLSGMAGVTPDVAGAFAPGVNVEVAL